MRVVCGMSGGVDSSVAALLLKEAGHEVVGLFMRNGVAAPRPRASHKSCCSVADATDARRVASHLGIPFYAANLKEDFDRLVGHFVDEYARGRTPNPCVVCNRDLKFGRILEYAEGMSAEKVATGHYARVERLAGGRWGVRRGVDAAKDQSYTIASLSQRQLEATLLPLGGMTKGEVRDVARRAGLPVAEKPESMEICFVPDDDYGRLVRERAPEAVRPGEVRDVAGRLLGRHEGTPLYTIGQRHGLRVALGRPAYVVEILPETNTIVVGFDEDTLSEGLEASGMNWVAMAPPEREATFRVEAQIRYHHRPAPSLVSALGDGRIEVRFDEPQRAVTPGQALVLYAGDTVLGGGWIDSGWRAASPSADLRLRSAHEVR